MPSMRWPSARRQRNCPGRRVTEVARLAAVFGDLRDRLRIRTQERERAERRLRFLADASSHLAASLDYATTLERVSWLAVPMLADWCLVDVVEDDGEIRRVEVAHADTSRTADADVLRQYPPDRRAHEGIASVLRTGVPELIHDLSESRLPITTRDERHQAVVRSLGAHSLMRVPMLARGRTLGVISFISTDHSRLYGPSDLALAEELAGAARWPWTMPACTPMPSKRSAPATSSCRSPHTSYARR